MEDAESQWKFSKEGSLSGCVGLGGAAASLDMYQSKVQLKLERMIDTLLATVLVPMGN